VPTGPRCLYQPHTGKNHFEPPCPGRV